MQAAAEGPTTEPSRRAELIIIGVVLALALAMRAVILFTGQRYLRSDEAVVGLMAKHIITRGEMPVFLYGQPYGGGHAIVAYLAAPLFAVFGRSAILLTVIPAAISLVNVWLLWAILRRYFPRRVALAAAALYAFSPPVVYQAFLVNGGTTTSFLALAALLFFLRDYLEGRPGGSNAFLAGLFGGLAYWGMDYALLYAVVFCLLWLAAGGQRSFRKIAIFAAGFLLGCLPLVFYNLFHDFAHFRSMFASPTGVSIAFIPHFIGALRGVVAGDLAAFFGGEIDDFKPAGIGSWIHAMAAIVAVVSLVYAHRAEILKRLRLRPLAAENASPLPAALLPVAFVLVYLIMYGASKFSLPRLRTPRYFLPLCPFVSIAVALVALRGRTKLLKAAGWALVAALAVRGAAVSLEVGTRPWHEEWRVRTSGKDITELAEFLREKNIKLAFAPYEIQWRLMFETNESVMVASDRISRLPRYEWYGKHVTSRVSKGQEKFAIIFRRDFAFAEIGLHSRETWEAALRDTGLLSRGTRVGENLQVFDPLSAEFPP